MHELSEQLGTVRKLIEQAPDSTLRSLYDALTGDGRQDASLHAISELVSAENVERGVRTAAFNPIAALCAPSSGPVGLSFPPDTPVRLWRALKACAPKAVADVVRAALAPDAKPAPLYDALCRKAAGALRTGATSDFAALAARLDARKDGAAQFALLLDLSPLVRRALPQLAAWSRNLNGEYDSSIRTAFHEALEIAPDAAMLMEALFAHLDDPYHVLRLVSSVMDRPSEQYLAASEMATFGERLMDDIDRRLEKLRRFDPSRGLEGGAEIGAAAHVASHGLAEFEERVILSRQGPWGARLQAQKRTLALAAEARLREVLPAVDAALPVKAGRVGPRRMSGSSRASGPPNPEFVARAQALLAFLHGVRTAAVIGGFGALRTKLVDDLTYRLDHQVEFLLTQLHKSGGENPDTVRAYLDVAAEFMGLVQDTKSAELVRRRAAAA